MKYFCVILLIGALALTGCNHNKTHESPLVIRADSFNGSIIADTIIYDVIIKNPNPDDLWTSECLKNIHHSALIDSLFHLVYAKQAVAYDLYSNAPLKVKDVKRMENEADFQRNQIGKIQFTERWYFDVSTQQFQKEVISITLGHELYNEEGSVRGYKPVYKLKLNH